MPTDFFGRVMVVFNKYGMSMLQGAGVSMRIALVGTLVGCIIGFAVGIVQTIPLRKGGQSGQEGIALDCKADSQRLCGIFPRDAHDGPGHVHLLRASASVRH